MAEGSPTVSQVELQRGERDGRILRSQATRRALLEAASEVFLAKGYGATTIDSIARVAGVAHGTFYSHFKGKEDIFIHVLDEIVEAAYTNLEGVSYEPSSLSDLHFIVKTQVLGAFRLALGWQPMLRVLHQAMGESPTIQAFWENGVKERLIQRTEADIRYSQAHGLYRALNARIVAESMVDITGHFMWQLVMGKQPADRGEHIAEIVTNLYLHGIYLEPS